MGNPPLQHTFLKGEGCCGCGQLASHGMCSTCAACMCSPVRPVCRICWVRAGEMKAVCAGALGLGCVIFMVLALGSIAAFGPALNSNILNNMSATGMAPLIGAPAAAVSRNGEKGGTQAAASPPQPAGSSRFLLDSPCAAAACAAELCRRCRRWCAAASLSACWAVLRC